MNRSDSLDQTHFHFVLPTGYFQCIDTIRQIVEAIPVQLLLVFFYLGLESTANDSAIIPKDGAQHGFLWFANLKCQVVDKNRRFDF